MQIVTAASASALLCVAADAAPMLTSIPIKFASDQPGRDGDDNSIVNGAAGVLNTVNWNNLTGQTGAGVALTLDENGNVVSGSPTVDFAGSAGNWSSTGKGEENNVASGENGDLMAGYLDTNAADPTILTVSGLNYANSPFALGYDVYVYAQGGVNGRGGTYTLGATTLFHEVTSAFDGTFLEDITPDQADPETFGSNYMVFRNVTGDSFTLTATPTFGAVARAPVNAIEIVAVPEPASFAALAGGVALLLGVRRRRSA
jgi:hypothetical protein